MDAYAAVINLKTGTRTPYRVVWTADMDANEPDTEECAYCGRDVPISDTPDTHDYAAWGAISRHHAPDCEWALSHAHTRDLPTCRCCTATTPADVDEDDWTCDDCTEQLAMADWFSRSHEAQDRAVLRGMG